MTETKDREIFSRIPMRTWRWLGVNESEWPEHAAENAKLDVLRAGIGETKEYVQVCRETGFQEVHVRGEDGAELHLVDVQLAPLDAPHAGRVHV
ncbi:MAG: SufD family Fe-S cluster assembly protein, partial [Selenomonadaceae bacterium]|nr:SufD family Fe-S cluster assembly protein [Selenomonadaceae bacterium]